MSASHVPICRILLVSDQPLTGLAIQDEFEDENFAFEGPVAVARTLDWLATGTPDLAILDVRVSEPRAEEIARVLNERGVHFVVVSSSERENRLPAFRSAPWIDKPWPDGRLHEIVSTLACP